MIGHRNGRKRRNLPVHRGFVEGRLTARPGGSHRLPLTSGFAPKPAVRLSWVEERLALVDTGSFPGRLVHRALCSSHFGAHLRRKIAHLFTELICDVIQLSRHLLRFTDHLKGALYHDVTAIRRENGFVFVDIGR
jgi:hypothetical protein